MEKLIEALQIFLKYCNTDYPITCANDLLHVGIYPELVSNEDKQKLDELGFFVSDDEDGFDSYEFGSC